MMRLKIWMLLDTATGAAMTGMRGMPAKTYLVVSTPASLMTFAHFTVSASM